MICRKFSLKELEIQKRQFTKSLWLKPLSIISGTSHIIHPRLQRKYASNYWHDVKEGLLRCEDLKNFQWEKEVLLHICNFVGLPAPDQYAVATHRHTSSREHFCGYNGSNTGTILRPLLLQININIISARYQAGYQNQRKERKEIEKKEKETSTGHWATLSI